jgi:hypothetical protein
MTLPTPGSRVERLLAPVAGFSWGAFSLGEELRRLARVLDADAPEAVIFYCGRTLEALAAAALGRVGAGASGLLINNLQRLDRFGLLPAATRYWCHSLRRLGNDVRHLHRGVGAVDADLACLFVERWLDWFFCRLPPEEGRLAALTDDGLALALARDADLRALMHRLEQPGCDPRAEVSPADRSTAGPWQATPAVAGLLAEMLIDRGLLAEAEQVLRAGRGRFPDDLHLGKLEGLRLSRAGRLAEARAVLEPLAGSFPDDGDTAGVLAGVYKRLWQEQRHARSWLERAYQIYAEGWADRRRRSAYLGINAAAVALWLGRAEDAQTIAQGVWNLLSGQKQALSGNAFGRQAADNYWDQTTLAEAALLRGEPDEARRLYREAFDRHADLSGSHASTRRQLHEHLVVLGLAADVDAFLGGAAD